MSTEEEAKPTRVVILLAADGTLPVYVWTATAMKPVERARNAELPQYVLADDLEKVSNALGEVVGEDIVLMMDLMRAWHAFRDGDMADSKQRLPMMMNFDKALNNIEAVLEHRAMQGMIRMEEE